MRSRDDRDLRPYTFSENLIDDILAVNQWFAEVPDLLDRKDLEGRTLAELNDEFRRQLKLLWDSKRDNELALDASSARLIHPAVDTAEQDLDDVDRPRGPEVLDPRPGLIQYWSRSSEQYIWERSG